MSFALEESEQKKQVHETAIKAGHTPQYKLRLDWREDGKKKAAIYVHMSTLSLIFLKALISYLFIYIKKSGKSGK